VDKATLTHDMEVNHDFFIPMELDLFNFSFALTKGDDL